MYRYNRNTNMTRSLYGKLHSKTPASADERKSVNEVWSEDSDIKWRTPEVKAVLPRTVGKNRALLLEAEAQGMLMIWFRAIIWAVIFILAAINFADAALIIGGVHYPAGLENALKAELSLLGTMDICFSAFHIILGLLMVFARFRVAAFKKGAPGLLFALTLLSAAVMIAVRLCYNLYAASFLDETQVITAGIGFIPMIVLCLVNFFYLKRRKELFVY